MIKYPSILIVLVITLLGSQQLLSQNIEHQFLNGSEIHAVSHQTYDYDQDGDLDILAMDVVTIQNKPKKQLIWLENDLYHRFSSKKVCPLGDLPTNANSFFLSDFNGDKQIDILILCEADAKNQGYLLLCLAKGAGVFSQKPLKYSFDFYQLISTDFNKDGRLDFIAIGFPPGYSPEINRRSGRVQELKLLMAAKDSFSMSSIYTDPYAVVDLSIGDLNQDGFNDLAIATQSTIQCLLNSKEGTFTKGQKFSIETKAKIGSLKIADINNDKNPEITYLHYFQDNLSFRYFDLKTFESKTLFLQNNGIGLSRDAFLADVNLDKRLDIVSRLGSEIYFHIQQKDGKFSPQKTISIDQEKPIELLDIDRDGDLDILSFFTPYYNRDTYWYENLNGKYVCHFISVDLDQFFTYHFIDIDKDKDQDILFTESGSKNAFILFKNEGNGVFTNFIFWETLNAVRIELLDVNQDGNVDPLICTYTGELLWLKNTGKFEVWASSVIDSNINTPRSILVQDINKDQRKDIIVGCYGDSKLILYQNLGAGKFNKSYLDLNSYLPKKILSSDINQDGFLDLVVLTEDSTSLLNIYVQNSTGTFSKNCIYTGALGKDMSLMDINGDQKPDIVYAANKHRRVSFHPEEKEKKQIFALINAFPDFDQTVLLSAETEPLALQAIHSSTSSKQQLIYISSHEFNPKTSYSIATLQEGQLKTVYDHQLDVAMPTLTYGTFEVSLSLDQSYFESIFTTRAPFRIIYSLIKSKP